jgi:Uma2 family endonuclease
MTMSTMSGIALDVLEADAASPRPRRMTEDEFVAWCDEDMKAEWVDGDVVVMAPANIELVEFDVWLLRLLGDFVEHHDLGVLLSPQAQVRLAGSRSRREPDALFIQKARLEIVKPTYIEGPPDLVVEIVSPDSAARDWREKYLEYEAAGVQEYWIFDPAARRAEAYRLTDGRYARIDEQDGRIPSSVLPGFFIRPAWLAGPKLPKVAAVLRELGVSK